MAHSKFIRHQLIRMFTMRLTQVLMQHDAMTDRQHTIYSIHQQENEIRQITRGNDHLTNQEQHDEGNTYRPYITGKALRLTFWTEVENAEHKYRKNLTQAEAEALAAKNKAFVDREYTGAQYFYYDEKDSRACVYYGDKKTFDYWTSIAKAKGVERYDLWCLGGNNW